MFKLKAMSYGVRMCKVCNSEFELHSGIRYTAIERGSVGVLSAFSGTPDKLFDACDCPICGSQNLLGERLPELNSVKEVCSTIDTDEEE